MREAPGSSVKSKKRKKKKKGKNEEKKKKEGSMRLLPKEWVGYHTDKCFWEDNSTQNWTTLVEFSCVMQWAGGRIHVLQVQCTTKCSQSVSQSVSAFEL